jgi:hypothetical protein
MAKLKDDEIRWILSLDAKGVQSELTGISSKSIQLTNENKILTAELKQTDKWLKEAERDMLKYSQAGDTTSKSYQRAKTSFDQLNRSAANLRQQIVSNNRAIKENDDMANQIIRTMRVEDMIMEQLKKRAKELEIQLYKTSEAADPKAYKQLGSELKDVEKRMGELKNGGDDTASMFSGSLTKGIVTVTAAIAAAKQGFRMFEDVMTSNRATGIEFNGMMDGLNNAMDYFKAALANMDFTNFIKGLKDAYWVGREVSLMLEDIYDRGNSFKLVSAKETAEIEELKTDLRDVNLSNAERLRIGNEIIDRTKKLAEEEKKIYAGGLEAAKKLLVSQTHMTDAEIEYMTVNRNANEQNIQNIKKIKDLEGDLILLRKNAATWEEYSNDGRNSYYVKKQKETNAQIKQYEKLIGKLKENYGFTDPKQYEIAANATEKYYLADKKMVDNYINSRLQMEQVDIKTIRSLKMTQRTIDALTKKDRDTGLGGTTPEQRQRTALNELNKKIEIKYQKDLADIKQKYRDGDIKTEAEYKRKIFATEQANYILRKELLQNFLKAPLDKKVRSDVEKELATLESKRLDKEIKYQQQLEKIILDANPKAREDAQFIERLDAVGLFNKHRLELEQQYEDASTDEEKQQIQQQIDRLDEYGIDRQKLTETQLAALELLEEQHRQNIRDINLRNDAKDKAEREKKFEESYKDTRTEDQNKLDSKEQEFSLQSGLGALNGDAAFQAELKIHNMRLDMIRKEIDARTQLGLTSDRLNKDLSKRELDLTKLYVKEFNRRKNEYTKYGQDIGNVVGNVITGQQDALQGFSDVMLDILFDVLTQIINAEITKTVAAATGAVARTTAEQVASSGFLGIGKAAILTGIITAAMTVAKSALKGLIGRSRSPKNDSSPKTTTVNKRVVNGYAVGGYTGSGGKYDVKGYFPDGQPYHADEYIIPKEEFHKPEFAPMIRAIENSRRKRTNANPLPEGFAEGGYHAFGENVTDTGNSQMMQMLFPLLQKLSGAIEDFNEKELEINLQEFERKKKTFDNARNLAKRK